MKGQVQNKNDNLIFGSKMHATCFFKYTKIKLQIPRQMLSKLVTLVLSLTI